MRFRDRSVTDLLDGILASVRQFTAGAVQSDDVTALDATKWSAVIAVSGVAAVAWAARRLR
jgi:hypothetical protein